MCHCLWINATSERAEQDVDDFLLCYDFEPTAKEKEIFEYFEVSQLTAEELTTILQERLDSEKQYPKFPFTKDDLSPAALAIIKTPANKQAVINVFQNTLRLKNPLD
jgi:hypothetical protein